MTSYSLLENFVKLSSISYNMTSLKKRMQMKIAIFSLLLLTLTVHADIGLHFDTHGNLVHPDDYLLNNAIKLEKKGFHKDALKNYTRSAEFGNKNAIYLIAMNYFKNKDYINGYAWLRLLGDSFLDVKSFKANLVPLLTKLEIQSSNSIYLDLQKNYSDIKAFERREKWEKSIKLTGSHQKGVKKSMSNLKIYFGDLGQSITQRKLANDIHKFKYEYEEIETNIKMGEIITLDSEKEQ